MATTKKFNPAEHLTNLKGKEYLEVKWRLVWFREENPEGSIETDIVELTDQRCVMRARVNTGTGSAWSTGYGSETPGDFKDYIEKAETKAIGRALAALGFGTQFAPELDEGERIADAPVERPKRAASASKEEAKGNQVNEAAMKRIHAILGENGLEHKHLHAYALAHGHKSSSDMSMDEMKRLADGLKEKTDVAVQYLQKLSDDFELRQAGDELSAALDAKGGK